MMAKKRRRRRVDEAKPAPAAGAPPPNTAAAASAAAKQENQDADKDEDEDAGIALPPMPSELGRGAVMAAQVRKSQHRDRFYSFVACSNCCFRRLRHVAEVTEQRTATASVLKTRGGHKVGLATQVWCMYLVRLCVCQAFSCSWCSVGRAAVFAWILR